MRTGLIAPANSGKPVCAEQVVEYGDGEFEAADESYHAHIFFFGEKTWCRDDNGMGLVAGWLGVALLGTYWVSGYVRTCSLFPSKQSTMVQGSGVTAGNPMSFFFAI